MLFIFYLPFTIIITIKYQTLSLVKVGFRSWFWLTLISCSLFSLFICFLVMRPLCFGISLDHGLYLTWVKCIFAMLWAAGEKNRPCLLSSFPFISLDLMSGLHAQTIMRAQICHLSPVSREEGNWSNVKVKEWSRVCFKEKMLNKHSIFPLNSVEGHVLDCFFTVWVYWWEELFFSNACI